MTSAGCHHFGPFSCSFLGGRLMIGPMTKKWRENAFFCEGQIIKGKEKVTHFWGF
jgi:hypothetical protein